MNDNLTPTDEEIANALGVDDVDEITQEMLDDVDTSVPDAFTDQVDLSEYKTAAGAAKAAGRKIKAIAEEVGHKPDVEVTVERRDLRDGHKWIVAYPAGRFDWAVHLTGGATVWAAEDPVLTGFFGSGAFDIECKNGQTLEFYPR